MFKKKKQQKKRRKAQAERWLTEKVRSVCAVVSSWQRASVWAGCDRMADWLAHWGWKRWTKGQKVSGGAEKHTPHRVHLNPVTEYGSEILTVRMSMK